MQSVVEKIAHAIARAEGYFVPGSRPQRNNNPGDLEYDVIGKKVGMDGSYVVYPDAETGWLALRTQVELMFHGSHIYTPQMTILQVAMKYTATAQSDWAKIVSEGLGVTPLTRLDQLT